MKMTTVTSLSVLMAGGVVALGCGAGGAAEAVRPADPTAAGALNEAECRTVDGRVEPLVVDWKPEQRGDLEVAMKEGVAVVAYDCQAFRLLPDCKIEGQYGYIGMTRKEQTVRLENSDEVKANLPLSGGQIGASMARDSTIDIAIVMVGKKRTTWREPEAADLRGSCEGATHYVRGATIGAFAMATGTKANALAAANVFLATAEGASTSGKQTTTREGDPSDCAKADPNAEAPPAQCGAPIRLSLGPIKKSADAAAPALEPASKANPSAGASEPEGGCPKGLVLSQGKCAAPSAALSYQCAAGDVSGCTEQCAKGHAGSCAELGQAYLERRDDARAADALTKGCDRDVARACVSLGLLAAAGRGVTQDPARAAKLFEKACAGGEARGCGELGRARRMGPNADPAAAAALLQKACNGGDDESCAGAARLFAAGSGVAKDPKAAADLHRRACDGNVAASCGELGLAIDSGSAGFPRDPIRAELSFRRGCYRGHAESCAELGRILLSKPLPDPANEAKLLFGRACNARVAIGCAALKVIYGDARPVIPDIAQKQALTQACNAGSVRDCTRAGLLDLAAGNKAIAVPALQRACTSGDRWACDLAKR